MEIVLNGILREKTSKSGVSAKGKDWTLYNLLVEKGQFLYPLTSFAESCAGIKIGDTVEAHCEFTSREWNGKYFLDLKANVVNLQQGGTPSVKQEVPTFEAPVSTPTPPKNIDQDEALPF